MGSANPSSTNIDIPGSTPVCGSPKIKKTAGSGSSYQKKMELLPLTTSVAGIESILATVNERNMVRNSRPSVCQS